jgi:uncharacterized surface protein with fasciclin (FAS1) repeats
LFVLLVFALVTGVATVAAQEEEPSTETPVVTQTVYDIIQSEPNLASSAALIDAIGLSDNLQGAGPFTVFAPTNDAWDAYEAMAGDLASDANVTDLLLYHVVNGAYTAADLGDAGVLPTLDGQYLFFGVTDVDDSSMITVNEAANSLATDIMGSNGIVHVVDSVILFPEPGSLFYGQHGWPAATIAEVLEEDGRFGTLLSLAEQAGLMAILDDSSGATYTVFAPTDEAFAALPEDLMNEWMADPEGALNTILSFHLVGDRLSINQIANAEFLPTLADRGIVVTTDEDVQVYLNGSAVESFNMLASNGVIHVMEEVILP